MEKPEPSHQEFTKYDEQGPYHWKQMRPSLRRFNAGLAARYQVSMALIEDCTQQKNIRSILDIGCGDGYFTSLLAKRFPEARVRGFDFSETAIKFARQMCPQKNAEFAVGDAFADTEHYDLVVATDVIEHVFDAGQFVTACVAKFTPGGGGLFLSTPVRIKEIPDDPFHEHEFFFNELENFVGEQGLKCLAHLASHDFSILENYGKRHSFLGLGKMRLGKYNANFRANYLNKNPFAAQDCVLPTMQYLYAELPG